MIFETHDGFEIARQDLLQRGPGEFLGQRQSGMPLLRYADLEKDAPLALEARDEFFVAAWFRFARGDGEASRRKIKELLAKRIATQPLAESNAGSVFRNPPGDHAARLIQASGLKGRRIGGAEVSTVHANFIVNKGGATARDIEELIELVQETIRREANVMLEREVRIVGEA